MNKINEELDADGVFLAPDQIRFQNFSFPAFMPAPSDLEEWPLTVLMRWLGIIAMMRVDSLELKGWCLIVLLWRIASN